MTSNEQIANMKKPPVVSAEEWQKAWQEMLVKEKEHTHARDALAAARRRGCQMGKDGRQRDGDAEAVTFPDESTSGQVSARCGLIGPQAPEVPVREASGRCPGTIRISG